MAHATLFSNLLQKFCCVFITMTTKLAIRESKMKKICDWKYFILVLMGKIINRYNQASILIIEHWDSPIIKTMHWQQDLASQISAKQNCSIWKLSHGLMVPITHLPRKFRHSKLKNNQFTKGNFSLFNHTNFQCSICYWRSVYIEYYCWIQKWSVAPTQWLVQGTMVTWLNNDWSQNNGIWRTCDFWRVRSYISVSYIQSNLVPLITKRKVSLGPDINVYLIFEIYEYLNIKLF